MGTEPLIMPNFDGYDSRNMVIRDIVGIRRSCIGNEFDENQFLYFSALNIINGAENGSVHAAMVAIRKTSQRCRELDKEYYENLYYKNQDKFIVMIEYILENELNPFENEWVKLMIENKWGEVVKIKKRQ